MRLGLRLVRDAPNRGKNRSGEECTVMKPDADKSKPEYNPLAVSVPEGAAAVGVSPRTLWYLIEQGKLPISKIGSRTVVRWSDLEKLLNDQRKAS
jgi:predicted DNA-binding transcriptional regulator AlpA